MEKEIEFKRECPKCKATNGFCLTQKVMNEDELYPCDNCGREFKLSEFKKEY